MAINEKYSYKTFKRQNLSKIDPKEFNNSEIVGSCFYQDKPYSDIFPPELEKVIFINCNLDNCNIPTGSIVEGGTNKHYIVANDQEYWLVNDRLELIAPRDEYLFDKCGLSKDPRDIPEIKNETPITITNDPKIIEEKKIMELAADPIRLRTILVEKGEI